MQRHTCCRYGIMHGFAFAEILCLCYNSFSVGFIVGPVIFNSFPYYKSYRQKYPTASPVKKIANNIIYY